MTPDELALENAGLARHFARRIKCRPAAIDIEDLEQVGMMALLRAARMFDPARAKFSTYGGSSIIRRMIREVRSGGTVRIPLWVVGTARQELERRLAASQLDLEIDVSADARTAGAAEAVARREEAASAVGEMLAPLEGRDRELIEAKLTGVKDTELAAKWGISRQRVRQLRLRLYERLRAARQS